MFGTSGPLSYPRMSEDSEVTNIAPSGRGLGSPEHLCSMARNFSRGLATYLKSEGSKIDTPRKLISRVSSANFRGFEPSATAYFRVLAAPLERIFSSTWIQLDDVETNVHHVTIEQIHKYEDE
ncbi:unnamed protein product [Didymodactylos carnosus]|uniref:Uncharacterized protein n=1 Tax=Didymodactylos carnosus TaxID=1234261 RepID=A0A815GKK6_9BILA|nr:unnamed protein product [Didymodactylos carnosus]CAF1340083.1 unnamed protein product [Didymodactylos carnosus]CAF4030412.1 unnamed protein product [Didymodactylos carnosus]CAF4200317.1 unnamed protein product [Didymodactylos carnosus]